jgi:SAM-dependent methyltransferase
MLDRAKAVYRQHTVERRAKGEVELQYWLDRKGAEGPLRHDKYEWFYTTEFHLSRDDYANKRVLDIGCGPRGSLEWADCAAERIGLDPLADEYRSLGIDAHGMQYVSSGAETIPFPDGYFDIVATFNSLDHVDDVGAAISEMTRVTAPGGTGLVIVEVNHRATPTEPHSLPWEVFEWFRGWSVELEKRTGIGSEHNVYASYRQGDPWHGGPGILGGRLRRLDLT